MIADKAVALRHVELLTGSPETAVNIRLIHDRDRDAAVQMIFGKIDDLWPQIEAAQANGFGVFLVVNAGGNSDREITTVRALFVDGDDISLPNDWHVKPDFVVQRDAKHWHAYWRVTDCTVSDFRAAQKRLVARYSSDPVAVNPSRVMRLAGTVHAKGAPIVIDLLDDPTIGAWELGRALAELTEGLPELPDPKAASTSVGEPVTWDHLVELLKYCDPDTERGDWIKIVAGLRATNAGAEDDRHTLAIRWSHGDLLARPKVPVRWTCEDDVTRVFETMPPKTDGAGYGAILFAAQAGGYTGRSAAAPPESDLEQTFGSFDRTKLPTIVEAQSITTPDRPRGIVMRHLSDWRAQKPMRWLVDGFIPDGETTLIHAPMGSFKSFIAGDLALSIAAGVPAFGKLAVKRAGPVVSFVGEGRRAFEMQRTEAWFKERGFSPPDDFQFATVQGVPQLLNAEHVRACVEAVDREFAGRQGGAIFIDPYSRTGVDENSTQDAGIAIELVEALKERFNCSVVMNTHEGLDPGRARGATALPAGFDNVWSLKRDNLAVEVRPVRLKDGPEDQSIFLQGRKVMAPVEGERAETLIFDLSTARDYRRAKAGKGGVTQAAITAALRKLASHEAIRTIVLAETIHATDPTAGSVNAIKLKLNALARGDFAAYVAHQGDGTAGDARTWMLPSVAEYEVPQEPEADYV